MPIVTKVESIGPTKAKAYLKKNGTKKNRKLRPALVNQYATEMRAGQWGTTGQGIIFDSNGHLLDGQHRLAAIVMSGKTIDITVTRGVAPKEFKHIDRGAVRTIGVLLQMAGHHYSTNLAAAIRSWKAIETVMEGKQKPAYIGRYGGSSHRMSVDSIFSIAGKHSEDFLHSIKTAGYGDARKIMSPPGLFGALHFMLWQINKGGCEEFFEKLIRGENLKKGDPVLLLRNRLHADRVSGRKQLAPFVKAAITIKAWNAFMQGKKLAKLTYHEDQEFPVIVKRRRS